MSRKYFKFVVITIIFFFYFFTYLEPKFVGSYMIPDNEDRDDNKVYFSRRRPWRQKTVPYAIYTRGGDSVW